jgi:septin family protein
MDDFASIINEQLKQLKEAVQKRGRVNLLVAGKTGVGKSTLINAVYQGNFARGTLLGRSALSAFLLLIPGAGPVLKGVVSGITAGAFTTAFGEAHIAAISHLLDRDPSKDPTADQIACRLREGLAKRNPFGRKAKHQTLTYAPHLLLGR